MVALGLLAKESCLSPVIFIFVTFRSDQRIDSIGVDCLFHFSQSGRLVREGVIPNCRVVELVYDFQKPLIISGRTINFYTNGFTTN